MNAAVNTVANALLDPNQDQHSETVPLVFPKPLDVEKSLMIDLITDRYEGVGAAQFKREETEVSVTLHVPKAIRPTFLTRAVS